VRDAWPDRALRGASFAMPWPDPLALHGRRAIGAVHAGRARLQAFVQREEPGRACLVRSDMKRNAWILLTACAAIAAGAVVVGATRYSRNDRWSLARFQLELIASTVQLYRADTGQLPASLDALTLSDEPGPGPYLSRRQLLDPWERALFYRVDPDRGGFVLFTLGRDGRLSGDGADADIQHGVRDQIPRK
jgi:general secretion pathway protein G